jgi:hypothetical protein
MSKCRSFVFKIECRRLKSATRLVGQAVSLGSWGISALWFFGVDARPKGHGEARSKSDAIDCSGPFRWRAISPTPRVNEKRRGALKLFTLEDGRLVFRNKPYPMALVVTGNKFRVPSQAKHVGRGEGRGGALKPRSADPDGAGDHFQTATPVIAKRAAAIRSPIESSVVRFDFQSHSARH